MVLHWLKKTTLLVFDGQIFIEIITTVIISETKKRLITIMLKQRRRCRLLLQNKEDTEC